MTMREIRIGYTKEGNIEAAYMQGQTIRNVVIDPRTGAYIEGTSKYGDTDYRNLVRAARAAIPITDLRDIKI